MRVVPLAAGDLDAALSVLPWLRLVRTDDGTFLACPSEFADATPALLARAGARAEPRDGVPEPARGCLPARAFDLAPVPLAGIVDTLAVRVLGTGEAATRLLRRGLFRRGPRDVDRLRAVLHGEDRVIGWRRVIWAERPLFRARELRGIRPIVFDRDAVAQGEERWILARDGALGRWIRR